MRASIRFGRLAVRSAILVALATSAGRAEVVTLGAGDFTGGAADRFGRVKYDTPVNYVYAKATGDLSTMAATFELRDKPADDVVLVLRGRDDDRRRPCAIEVAVNGRTVLSGASGFPDDTFATRRVPLPAGVLRKGSNRLTVANAEPDGTPGVPPWFMVAGATVAPAWALPVEDFRAVLPDGIRPIPEEPAAADAPRFKFRGTKGWNWSAEQYLQEIPHLKRAKMNFLMNCYLSMFDERSGRNRWWEPLPEAKKRAYEQVVRACRESGITYCFAMHPQFRSDRPMDLSSPDDFETFFAHFAWAQGLGVKWFSVSMDDVSQGHAGAVHAEFCNKFLRRLREKDPEAQLIFCPTVYATDQIRPGQPYLESLAEKMDRDVYVFWTGPQVVPTVITRAEAEHYRSLVGHRLILWDNYPVNDAAPTLHLGPITGRDPRLCDVIDGYMANPLYPQNQVNRVPLYTQADYAYNPAGYDPMRSVGQAVMHLAETPAQRRALANLIELYAGDIIWGTGRTDFNPVREQYRRLTTGPTSRVVAGAYIQAIERAAAALDEQFPDSYGAAKATVANDVEFLKAEFAKRFGAE